MNSTGRPKNPPFALMSSRHSSRPIRMTLPAPALGPVSDMPKPTLIGFAASAGRSAIDAAPAAAPRRSCRRLKDRTESVIAFLLLDVEQTLAEPGAGAFAQHWRRLGIILAFAPDGDRCWRSPLMVRWHRLRPTVRSGVVFI